MLGLLNDLIYRQERDRVNISSCLFVVSILLGGFVQAASAETVGLRGLDDKQPVVGISPHGVLPVNEKQPVLGAHLEKNVLDHPLTLAEAVSIADKNYPVIMKGESQVKAAKDNITVQKLNEYLPDSLFQYQELMAAIISFPRLFMWSCIPSFTRSWFSNTNMQPIFSAGQGFSVDWAPIDFGLHKARINLAKTIYKQTEKQFAATKLDIEIATASAFLNAVQGLEQVKAAEENLKSFNQFSQVVHAQVNAELKPGADASLADAQLANAENLLYRAKLALDVSSADLANSIGFGGRFGGNRSKRINCLRESRNSKNYPCV